MRLCIDIVSSSQTENTVTTITMMMMVVVKMMIIIQLQAVKVLDVMGTGPMPLCP
jgi:hypothetical protein